MQRASSAFFIACCLAAPVQAQTFPDPMVITVQPDSIIIGKEPVPRFLTLPNKLIVGAGQTVTLLPDSTFDYIEVSGTLRCDPALDTRVSYIHFFVLPGGTFDCDVPAHQVELIGRDVPIDTTKIRFSGVMGF